MPRYFVSESTKTLHIEGLCRFTRDLPNEVKFFDTEDEAKTIYQGHMKQCKICWKNRDSNGIAPRYFNASKG